MGTLPEGTISLLFSDIEGSTQLLRRLGSAYAEALDGQRLVLRDAWAAHAGVEMGTEGDSFFVVFETAQAALGAAAQAQRDLAVHEWPQGERVRVRMGVHTGSPTVHDGGYVGMDVHRAARIAGAAHGGQVVVSAATAELVGRRLAGGVTLRHLGPHRLKDLAEPENLYQLVGDGLASEFPPLKTLGGASSLPLEASPLVGRALELSELGGALEAPEVRVVTVTGPGGVGKTRLAIALAHQVSSGFPDGVFFVPLARFTTADGMWASIGEVLAVPPGDRLPPAVFAHLAHRAALVVLDNLEQLRAADAVVEQLTTRAPGVVVLATSRRPLHVRAEHEYPLAPLALGGAGLAEAGASAAVQLFVQQAHRVNPRFALTAANAADVVSICRRMDGLPLAIELVAARTRMLSPRALLTRLDAALDIAAEGSQGPGRHRTLRETVAWSYDLLGPGLRFAFRQLGVFAGGADLAAFDEVAVQPDDSLPADPLDTVADLLDASLVAVSEMPDGEPRIGLLESVRAFALDELAANDELEAAQQRHAHHYLKALEQTASLSDARRNWEVRAWFETEDDNIRAALRWALPKDDPGVDARAETGLRLCSAWCGIWEVLDLPLPRGHAPWLERAIERADDGDNPHVAQCLFLLAAGARLADDLDQAQAYATSSLNMWRRLNQPDKVATVLSQLAGIANERGDLATAFALVNESTTIARQYGDTPRVAIGLHELALYEFAAGNHERAIDLCRDAIEQARELGLDGLRLMAEHNLACGLHLEGEVEAAEELMRAAMPDLLRRGNPLMLIAVAEDYASVLGDLDRHHQAAKLYGAADASREHFGWPRDQQQQAHIANSLQHARAALRPHEWDTAYQSGRDSDPAHALTDATAPDADDHSVRETPQAP